MICHNVSRQNKKLTWNLKKQSSLGNGKSSSIQLPFLGIQNPSFGVCWWRPGFPLPSATPVLTTKFLPPTWKSFVEAMRFEPSEKRSLPQTRQLSVGFQVCENTVGYISHLETAAKIGCDPWYAHFLTGPQHLSPKDSRRDAKACQAKRLKISKEMQTFMKDSKSSRKAAGIPWENKN